VSQKGVLLLSPTPPDPELVQLFEREGVKLLHRPVIGFEFLTPSVRWEGVTHLLFTSKTAVKGIERLGEKWREIPAIAVGKGTAREVEKRGGKVVFTGSGYGEELIEPVVRLVKEGKLLFPRPEVVATPVASLLRSRGVEVEEVILYRTQCRPIPDLSRLLEWEVAVLFSSPSTFNCLFSQIQIPPHWELVAIGRKTADSILARLNRPVHLPPTPSLRAGLLTAFQLLKCGG
jgi:uroporphyrinogen-III synthase